jgi:excisionase family DNA binding protein
MHDILHVGTVAAVFQVHASTIRRLLATGELEGIRIGKRAWRIPHAKLHAYMARQSNRADEGVLSPTPAQEGMA